MRDGIDHHELARKRLLANLPETDAITAAAIHAMIDSLRDVDQVLGEAEPDRFIQLYEQLHLDLRYNPRENVVEATSSLHVVGAVVRTGVAHYSPARR